MKPLEYHAPTSLDEAISILKAEGSQAAALSGGTDLIIQNRARPLDLAHMVDIKRIPELNVLEYDAKNGLRLGAAVPCYKVAEYEPIVRLYPALAEGAELIGSIQIQSRATVGGNICNGSPAADTICALIVLGAICAIRGPDGNRDVPAVDFMVGPGETALKPGEILVEMRLPPPPAQSSNAYLRFIPRNEMDIAVVCAAANITMDDKGVTCTAATVAIGAVGPTPILVQAAGAVLTGAKLDAAAIAKAAKAASAAARPIDDHRGTVEFRTHVAGVLTRRTVELAAQRIKEDAR